MIRVIRLLKFGDRETARAQRTTHRTNLLLHRPGHGTETEIDEDLQDSIEIRALCSSTKGVMAFPSCMAAYTES